MRNKAERIAEKECKSTSLPSHEYTVMQEKIDELIATVKVLKNENTQLRKILENGEIGRLEEMVNDFQRVTKKSLKDISDEASMTDFSIRTIDCVNNLIDFLSYTSKELYALVSISTEGYFSHNEDLRKCEKLKEDLLSRLNKSNFTSSIIPEEAERMAKVLQEAVSNIADCMKEDD